MASGRKVTLKVQSKALIVARELLGVSKKEFESELESFKEVNRPMLNLERPGIGAEIIETKKNLAPTEKRLMTSIHKKRQKRAREGRIKREQQDSSSEDEEEKSKVQSFRKRK